MLVLSPQKSIMRESFGTRLRQRRERRRIALATIAEQTKIKASLLEELEHDDTSHWPSGIFRRAFIRAYAEAIGLEPDEVVREFLAVHPDPVETVASVADLASGADRTDSSTGPTGLRRVGAAMGSLLGLRPIAEVEPVGAIKTSPPAADEPLEALRPSSPDLTAAAELCTELGRLEDTTQLAPLVQEAAAILNAVGVIVWVWDPQGAELKPLLAHGYSDRVLAQLPRVARDAGNATAAAYRSARTSIVRGSDCLSGALAVPLVTPRGSVGVLAVELQDGAEQIQAVRAVVMIFAAQLARIVEVAQPAQVVDRRLA